MNFSSHRMMKKQSYSLLYCLKYSLDEMGIGVGLIRDIHRYLLPEGDFTEFANISPKDSRFFEKNCKMFQRLRNSVHV